MRDRIKRLERSVKQPVGLPLAIGFMEGDVLCDQATGERWSERDRDAYLAEHGQEHDTLPAFITFVGVAANRSEEREL